MYGVQGEIDDISRSTIKDEIMKHVQIDDDIIILAHDVYTGPLALEASNVAGAYAHGKVKTCIIRHVDFSDYQPLDPTRSQKEIYERNRSQIDTLRRADYVFSVGPILYRSSRSLNIRGKLSELTPGISRSPYNPQREYPSIMAFGRFDRAHNYVKQSAVVAEAFSRLCKTISDPARSGMRFWRDARLTLVGVEDDHANDVTTYVSQQAGMAANVHVVPFVDDPEDITDIFLSRGINMGIVPSLRESFGLVALEFIGHGIPLILSERTGVFQWLYDLYAGEALGCLSHFAPVGSPDPNAPNPQDVAAIFGLIEKSAIDLEHKVRNASFLRRRLSVHSWEETALQFGTVVGLQRQRGSLEIEQGAMQLAMFQAQFTAKVSDRIAEARAKEIVAKLDKYISTGRYKSAEIELDQLKKLEMRNVSLREIKLYEIQLETRLGLYLKALKSIDEWS